MSECAWVALFAIGGVLLLVGVLGWMGHRERMRELANARPDQ